MKIGIIPYNGAMQTEVVALMQTKAKELGFTLFGVVPARPARRLVAYRHWIEQEMHGTMGYMARPDRIARREDLNVILPGVQSIICVGLDYYTLPLPVAVAADPSRGRISNYAWGLDYHDVMTPRLHRLAQWLQTAVGTSVQQRVYVDTGAILERDHAETAGLGFTGKNTMLLHPRRGSWFFLGEILTTALLSAPEPAGAIPLAVTMPSCGRCRRCLDACPTAAFPAPYVLDARRCISYLTIELKGWIPRQLRPLLGNWVYGCDICQEVCPFNRFAGFTAEASFYPGGWKPPGAGESPGVVNQEFHIRPPDHWDQAAPPLLALLALDEKTFEKRFARSPIKRIKRLRLVRNACVAAGNWGAETAVGPLVQLLADDEPIIRGHAAWALHQIGSPTARQALSAALLEERDPDVRREIGNR